MGSRNENARQFVEVGRRKEKSREPRLLSPSSLGSRHVVPWEVSAQPGPAVSYLRHERQDGVHVMAAIWATEGDAILHRVEQSDFQVFMK